MRFQRRFFSATAVAVILIAATTVVAQRPALPPHSQNAALTDTIPVDPLITVRTLPNGLRYYVRANRVPAGRAELRLAVKAGSVLEDDDQRGLAHFVEHMAFNGTRNFPGNAVGTFMQSIGVRFGARVNNAQFPLLLKGSRYADRMPIGQPEIIRNVNPERLKQFYADWYRPDLM